MTLRPRESALFGQGPADRQENLVNCQGGRARKGEDTGVGVEGSGGGGGGGLGAR